MGNPDLAQQARQLADQGGSDRPAWLCVAVAIATTRTTAAAKKALREWQGPAVVVDRALELIDQLAGR